MPISDSPDQFLKKRKGKLAWGPVVKDDSIRSNIMSHYGSTGFNTRRLKSGKPGSQTLEESEFPGFKRCDSNEDFANTSTETIDQKKKTVMRR